MSNFFAAAGVNNAVATELPPADLATAQSLANEHIRRVLRGSKPNISGPYIDRDGHSATLCPIGRPEVVPPPVATDRPDDATSDA